MSAEFNSLDDLDPFTAKRFPEISRRWSRLHGDHQVMAQTLWLGTMVSNFDDEEILILDKLGFICPQDLGDLRRCGRLTPKEAT